MPNPRLPASSRGFTLLETLIAFIVLVFGLLGAVALQARAKQASFDAMQRAAALGLAHDISERIKSNTTAALAGTYNAVLTSNDTLSGQSCINAQCNTGDMAAYDLDQWRSAIKAKENTGALSDATVCITVTPDGAQQLGIEVIVTWESRQELALSDTSKVIANKCAASTTSQTRILNVNSYTYIRSV